MGLKWRGVVRCGSCGKPRGFGTHLCNPGRRKRRRSSLQRPVTWECGSCHKPRGLVHTCAPKSDFKARKRSAATRKRRAAEKARTKATAERRRARRQQAAAERRARARERKRQARGTPRPRPRGESHEPGTCGNRDCPKFGCKSYWQGMADCPGPHDGGG
jgi:hypothetical protein